MWKTLFYLLTLFCESKIILLKKSITKKKIYKSEFASKQWEKLGGGTNADKTGRELTMLKLGDTYMEVPFFY